MSFKNDFVWGAATASYQIEGAAYEDGKGLNIWDIFSHEEDKISYNHNGDIACNHYYRIEEDVALMKKIGLKAYRFSVSWARILPDGIGEVNQKGIDFYNKLIDELIKNDIEPYMTLFHWDLPYELSKKGGWMNEECVEWFENYSKIIAENFSDRVKYFMTLNEPPCFVGHGYGTGIHAPGLKVSIKELLQTIHNVLKAHGKSVITLRKYAKQPIQIAYAPCGNFNYPATDSLEDIEAARKSFFDVSKNGFFFSISLWNDPIFLGHYNEKYLEEFKDCLPVITDEDMKLISQPLDFVGLNIYFGKKIKATKDGNPEVVPYPDGYQMSAMDWAVSPKSMYWGTRFFFERYNVPIYIAENGISCRDYTSSDGKVHDRQRIDFLSGYLKELKRSSEDGTDIRGYFHWSLMDNFEWSFGYKERFGLIYVDFETQERILKDSAYHYGEIIAQNGENL